MIVIVSVERAQHELDCRRCGRPIRPGQRAVLVLGAGTVHLRCLLAQRTPDAADQTALADDGNVPAEAVR